MITQFIPKALVLDRDGTIIQHTPYLSKPDEVKLLPGARNGLRKALDCGLRLFLHTNQSGVGRGLFSLSDAEACTSRMIELLDIGERPFERICTAPEHPDAPALYRKPSPLFANEIMRDYNYFSQDLCYIGDRGTDLATAQAACTQGAGVATGLDDLVRELSDLGLSHYPVFSSLDLAVQQITGIIK